MRRAGRDPLEGRRQRGRERAGHSAAAVELYRAAASKTTSLPERNYLLLKAARVMEAIALGG